MKLKQLEVEEKHDMLGAKSDLATGIFNLRNDQTLSRRQPMAYQEPSQLHRGSSQSKS